MAIVNTCVEIAGLATGYSSLNAVPSAASWATAWKPVLASQSFEIPTEAAAIEGSLDPGGFEFSLPVDEASEILIDRRPSQFTRLSQQLGASDIFMKVDDPGLLSVGSEIWIGSEKCVILSSGGGGFDVSRAHEGTWQVPHDSESPVFLQRPLTVGLPVRVFWEQEDGTIFAQWYGFIDSVEASSEAVTFSCRGFTSALERKEIGRGPLYSMKLVGSKPYRIWGRFEDGLTEDLTGWFCGSRRHPSEYATIRKQVQSLSVRVTGIYSSALTLEVPPDHPMVQPGEQLSNGTSTATVRSSTWSSGGNTWVELDTVAGFTVGDRLTWLNVWGFDLDRKISVGEDDEIWFGAHWNAPISQIVQTILLAGGTWGSSQLPGPRDQRVGAALPESLVDIDAFKSLGTQPVSVFVREPTPASDLLNQIVSLSGGLLYVQRETGKLSVVPPQIAKSPTPLDSITASDVVEVPRVSFDLSRLVNRISASMPGDSTWKFFDLNSMSVWGESEKSLDFSREVVDISEFQLELLGIRTLWLWSRPSLLIEVRLLSDSIKHVGDRVQVALPLPGGKGGVISGTALVVEVSVSGATQHLKLIMLGAEVESSLIAPAAEVSSVVSNTLTLKSSSASFFAKDSLGLGGPYTADGTEDVHWFEVGDDVKIFSGANLSTSAYSTSVVAKDDVTSTIELSSAPSWIAAGDIVVLTSAAKGFWFASFDADTWGF